MKNMFLCQSKRYADFCERANKGKKLVVGFLGGSITEGTGSSNEDKMYAYLVYQWLCQKFPNANFVYLNAGIGGTPSYFGVARVEEDILQYQPDMVVVDFTVNDEANEFYEECYEGLIRKIMKCESTPAIMALGNVQYDTGINAEEYHTRITKHYGVPFVSAKQLIYNRIVNGELTTRQVTEDDLHPNDFGHELLAQGINEKLALIFAGEYCDDNFQLEQMPDPLTENKYESVKRVDQRDCCPVLEGFVADTEEKIDFHDYFKQGWIADQVGAKLTLEVEATSLAVQYRKTIQRPAPIAMLYVDHNRVHPISLNANFDEDWGECLYAQSVFSHKEKKKHTIEIEITRASDEDVSAFYLMSFFIGQ